MQVGKIGSSEAITAGLEQLNSESVPSKNGNFSSAPLTMGASGLITNQSNAQRLRAAFDTPAIFTPLVPADHHVDLDADDQVDSEGDEASVDSGTEDDETVEDKNASAKPRLPSQSTPAIEPHPHTPTTGNSRKTEPITIDAIPNTPPPQKNQQGSVGAEETGAQPKHSCLEAVAAHLLACWDSVKRHVREAVAALPSFSEILKWCVGENATS